MHDQGLNLRGQSQLTQVEGGGHAGQSASCQSVNNFTLTPWGKYSHQSNSAHVFGLWEGPGEPTQV